MMLEDRLDKDERIRLEALAQANVLPMMRPESLLPIDIIHRAKQFEKYIRGEEQ